MTFPRRAEPKIIPRRARRSDAQDIADEVMAAAKGGPVTLHILPNREYRIAPAELALVGLYRDGANRDELIADIEKRCAEIAEEEAIYEASKR